MHEPDISRRCSSCGASIRDRAFFCPKCGAEVDAAQKDGSADVQGRESPEVAKPFAEDPPAVLNQNSMSSGPPKERLRPNTSAKIKRNYKQRPRTVFIDPASAQKPTAVAGRGDIRHRATAVARDVIEDNVLQRVEKLRKVSSVVIDEAAYDPSVRFLLVAAALFLIFLVIVLLNKLIG